MPLGFTCRANTLREFLSYDGAVEALSVGWLALPCPMWWAVRGRRYVPQKQAFALYELRFHLLINWSSRRHEVAKARTERAEEHARSRISDSRDGAGAGLRTR